MRKILNISVWILSAVSVIILLGFVAEERKSATCQRLEIRMLNEEESAFITSEEVLKVVQSDGDLVGIPVEDINLRKIERLIRGLPEVKSAEVYIDLQGRLIVDVKQRNPLVRIFAKNGDSYYIDEEGYFMPLSTHYTARVPVATGRIHLTYPVGSSLGNVRNLLANDSLARLSSIDEIFNLCSYLKKDDFWFAMSEQINVNDQGDLELIPRVGNYTILIGDAERLESKFAGLLAMYKSGFPANKWESYSSVNLKFQNQVICTKK